MNKKLPFATNVDEVAQHVAVDEWINHHYRDSLSFRMSTLTRLNALAEGTNIVFTRIKVKDGDYVVDWHKNNK